MPHSTLIFILSVAALIVFGAAWIYAGWEDWDDRRRSERLVHRNLQRMAGR